MIDVLKTYLGQAGKEGRVNLTREFLQQMALKILYEKGWSKNLIFVGGTALRVIFDLNRFSEDLDFSLENKAGYDFPKMVKQTVREFELNGFNVEAKVKAEKTVHSTFLRFKGLLKELGVSGYEEEKISIKLDIDTRPPEGGVIQKVFVNKIFLFQVTHYEISSLFATKLCACFYRKYTKGRDFYDLIWYLGKKIKPNYLLLNNAIEQTQGVNPGIHDGNIKDFLLQNIEKIDFQVVAKDVERFLIDKNELKLFDLAAIRGSIELVFGSQ